MGFQLDRHELDQVYGFFLALADHAKVVDDSHLLDLIRQARIASGTAERPRTVPDPVLSPLKAVGLMPAAPMIAAHDGEQQEDYLWGV